jgi:hypothetical protein
MELMFQKYVNKKYISVLPVDRHHSVGKETGLKNNNAS